MTGKLEQNGEGNTSALVDWRPSALEFAEKMGRLAEARRQPRMVGRVFGWLLVCDPPHQTTAELAAELQASNSSVNAMLHLLVGGGIVERVTFPGQRSACFRASKGGFARMIFESIPNIRAFRQLADEALSEFSWKPAEDNERLLEFRDVHRFFEREMPQLLERWEQEHVKREP